MKVKTYKNQSLQEGLENIKRDLGSDALILGTRSVSVRPRFGLFRKPTWEITAAVNDKPVAVGPVPTTTTAPSVPLTKGDGREAAGGRSHTAVALAPAPTRDPGMAALITEIGELKKSFRSLSKAMPGKTESTGGLYAELISQGLDHDVADQFISTASYGNPAPTELRERVRRKIADQLIVAPPAELHARSRMVAAFVGATGVGKTTTIAKIAGHAAIRMKKKVAMISTDMFRIGGHEQLSRFGELLGIPTYGCSDVASLKDLVESLEDRDLILIDTPGSSPSDMARLAKLESVTSVANAKVHLVISATTRSEDITKIIIRFQRFKPNTVILTKIDETDSKGPLAGDLLRNEIPVSYVTNGQRVPEDLLIPDADELSRYVLPAETAI
jgi:flagellar biosynthesis protein FlhF